MFQCTLNNCEVASEHVQILKSSLDAEVGKVFAQLSEQGEAKLEVSTFFHKYNLRLTASTAATRLAILGRHTIVFVKI